MASDASNNPFSVAPDNAQPDDGDVEPRHNRVGTDGIERDQDANPPIPYDCWDSGAETLYESDAMKEKRERGELTYKESIRVFDACAISYCAAFGVYWLLLLMDWQLWLTFFMVVCVPLYLLVEYMWKPNMKHCTLTHVVHAVGLGFFVITLTMVCLSYAILIIAFSLLISVYSSGGFEDTSTETITFTFYVFVIIPFVFSEEYLKALFVRLQRRRVRAGTETKAHLIHSTSVSVGYAVSQAMSWTIFADAVLASEGHYIEHPWFRFGALILIGIAVTVFGTPLQLLSGYLVGLEVTRGAYKCCGTASLFPAVVRCLYYSAAIGWLILLEIGTAGFSLFFLTNMLFIGVLVWRIKEVEKLMPYGYLQRVGYLNMGGYGILPPIDNPILAAANTGTIAGWDEDEEAGGDGNESDDASDGDGATFRTVGGAEATDEDGQFEDVDVSGDVGYNEADFGVPASSIQMAVVGHDDVQEESV